MVLYGIWLYLIFALLGLFFQNFLHSGIRIVIYPLSFILGLVIGYNLNYYVLSFNLGMISRAVIGGYWHCVVVESLCLLSGIVIGVLLL